MQRAAVFSSLRSRYTDSKFAGTRLFDYHADIQRREFEDAHRACDDHSLWGASARFEPPRLTQCVLISLASDGEGGRCPHIASSRIDVFNFAQTSVAVLALAALVFL